MDVDDDIMAGYETAAIPVGNFEKYSRPVPLGIDTDAVLESVGRPAPQAFLSPSISFSRFPFPSHLNEPGWCPGDIAPPTAIYRRYLYPISQPDRLAPQQHHHGPPGRRVAHPAGQDRHALQVRQVPMERTCAVVADPMKGSPKSPSAGTRMLMFSNESRNSPSRMRWKGCKSRMNGMTLKMGWPTRGIPDGSDGKRRAEGNERFDITRR